MECVLGLCCVLFAVLSFCLCLPLASVGVRFCFCWELFTLFSVVAGRCFSFLFCWCPFGLCLNAV